MFKTIFTVEKNKDGSNIYQVFFESYDEAKAFAESEVKKLKDNFVFNRENHLDGSFCESWIGDVCEIWLHDDAWADDWRTNGVRFHYSAGISTEFENEEQLTLFINKSQERAAI